MLVLFVAVELLWPQRAWMMLVIGLGGAWLLDFLWARSLARGLRLQRELRYGWVQVGDALEERFTLIKEGGLPALWVELRDFSTLPDYQANLATGVDGWGENTWSARHLCTRRGVFTVGPTTLRSGTPFAIYTVEIEYAARQALMIMPSEVPLPNIQVATGGRAYEGKRRASTLERTVSASGVRDYVVGDPYKALYWRAVAHTGELMVRTFESTPAGDWWVWLDLDAREQAGTGANSTVEHAVMLAASLAGRGLATSHAVGLVANARELVWLTPQTGETQRLRILQALTLVEPGERALGELLLSTRQSLSRNSSIILITAAMGGEWLRAVLACMAGGIMPTLLVLDRASYGGSGDLAAVIALAQEWGIPHYVITRDMLDKPEARPGRAGQWEWRMGATGRAVARRAPSDQSWRTLA